MVTGSLPESPPTLNGLESNMGLAKKEVKFPKKQRVSKPLNIIEKYKKHCKNRGVLFSNFQNIFCENRT